MEKREHIHKEWPSRPSEMKEILYFFNCLGPFLLIAVMISIIGFLAIKFIGDTAFGVIVIGSILSAVFSAYRRYPTYLIAKALKSSPRIRFDGRIMKFTVKSGIDKEIVMQDDTRFDLAYYSLPSSIGLHGVLNGLWLEIQNSKERFVFTGRGDFKLSIDQHIVTKAVPFTPFDQKVETFSQVLIDIHDTLLRAR